MAGYSRQSVADIIASAIIRAAPVNAEYNAIRDAFAFATGHKHDGSSTEGAYVPLIADTDAKNKVVVDTANNRISVYSEVGGSAVEQLRIQDGAIVPVTDDDVDLGASGAEFKDLYIDGVGYLDSVVITGGTIDNTVIGGTTPAAVTGTTITGTELVGPVTGNITGDVTGNLTGDVTGNVTGNLTGDVTSTGTSTFATVDINSGTIDGTVIGETAPASADFTTVDTTSNVTVGGTLGVTGLSTFTGAMSAGSLTTTGNSTHATVDINGGAIDGTIIGASSAAAGTFTTVTTTGQATLATADINGGTIDGSVIGGATPQAVTGTTITANTGFTGALTGNVTGNVTGNLTGNVTGDVTGDLTGNVTASTGTTTLNDLVVNGTVDFTSTALLNVSDPTAPQHASTKIYTDTADALKLNLAGGTMSGDITMGGNTVTGLGTPIADSDAATKGFVDTSIANVIDAAPAALDTLNELAAALGDDASFSTTVTNSVATKLPLAGGTMTGDIALGANKATSTATPATDDTLTRKGYVDTQDALKLNLSGGTMSGAIAMGTSKITGVGDPTSAQDVSSKAYTDTQDATKLNLSGGTMTGAIDMGANKVTTTYTPTDAADLTTKTYVDGILSSATDAATSAAAAATSASEAATSASNAATSEANAEAVYDSFDDRYLGDKASAPTVDNDGDALAVGALYFNTTGGAMYVWNGTAWQGVSPDLVGDITPQLGGNLDSNGNDITFGDSDKAIFGAGSDLQIYHNGYHSYIDDAGTGSLYIRAADLNIQSITGENYINAVSNGAVTLNYNNSTKLATTSTGVDITGTLTSDALTVDKSGSTIVATLNRSDSFTGYINFKNTATTTGFIGYESSDFAIYADNVKVLQASDGGDISFYEDTGTTPKFFWDASAESLGIGTSSPATSVSGSSQGLAVQHSNVPFISLDNTGSSGRRYTMYSNTGGSLVTYDEDAAASRMVIDSSGKVGIGTSSPSELLSLEGVVGPNADAPYLALSSGRPTDRYSAIGLNRGNTSNQVGLSFYTTNNLDTPTEKMRIDSSGNVGIGTSSLGYTGFADNLTIADSSNGGLTIRTGASAQGAIYFSDTTGDVVGQYAGFLVYNQSGNHMAFGTSSTEAMRIDSSGNVGIGTSSPNTTLNVNGTSSFGTTSWPTTTVGKSAGRSLVGNEGVSIIWNEATAGAGNSGVLYIGAKSGAGASTMGYATLQGGTENASDLSSFFTVSTTNGVGAQSEAMRIDSSGRVGIGTSSPSGLLQIEGITDHLKLTYPSIASYILDVKSNGDFAIDKDGSERMRIDSSGRVGIGGVPNTNWRDDIADQKVLMLGTEATLFSDAGITTELYNNAYINDSDTIINISTRGASRYFQYQGAHKWYTAASASAGSNINTEMTSPKMTLDVSGNLLVGQTSASGFGSTTGIQMLADGRILSTVSGDQALALSRTSSDGPIAEFYKDGSTVGSIGSEGGDALYIQSGTTSGTGLLFTSNGTAIRPARNGVTVHDTLDLGSDTRSFKDLYLSGVGYVGTIEEANTSLSGTTPSIDADTAGSFTLTTSGNTTFTFAGVTSGRSVGFVLKLTAGGGHTITWPSSVDWAGGTAPDAPASGETDVLVFYTVDGGTNWYGALAIDAAA